MICRSMNTQPLRWRARQARGATLIELTVALAVSAIPLATTSVVVIASKAVPNTNDVPTSIMSAGNVLDRMAAELETATLVLQQTPTSITFLIPGRSGSIWPSASPIAGAEQRECPSPGNTTLVRLST